MVLIETQIGGCFRKSWRVLRAGGFSLGVLGETLML